MKEALFYEPAENGRVRCRLCHHYCTIAPGRRGMCGVRENRDGVLYTLVYGRAVALHADPVEKKPLYHFLPGSSAFSVATRGCNFRCKHCQNCDIAFVEKAAELDTGRTVSPEDIVSGAVAYGCESIAYTYTEPTIFAEYALDTARLARERGLRNIFVTNGYITPEALREFQPVLDAANIDLKFFREDLYRDICGAKLQPVLDMIRMYHAWGIWTELTTLVIPGYNDDEDQLNAIAEFIAGVAPDIPWHISAFFPTHRLTDAPPTPSAALERAREAGRRAGLKYIYLGNVGDSMDIRCPTCGKTAVQRRMYDRSRHDAGESPACPSCGAHIAGIWK